jgi:hypothetical protein
MNGNFFNKSPSLPQKPISTHYEKKYAKSIDFSGLLFPAPGIKAGTIQLTLKNNHK